MQKSIIGVLNKVITTLIENHKGVINMLADTLSRLADLALMEPNPAEMGGHEYGDIIFEPLPDINVSSIKHTPVSSIAVTSIETKSKKMLKFM